MGLFNTCSMSTRSCALVNNVVMSGLPILAGRTWPYSANLRSIRCTVDIDILKWRAMDLLVLFSTKCASTIRQRRSKSYMEQALRRTASVPKIQVAFSLNLSRRFLNIIFVRTKPYCSFSVKYTCFVSHLFDEKTKGIYISYIL